MKQRRSFGAEQKAKIAIEAIKGQKTVQEIASHFEVHPNQVSLWKKQALERMSELFSDRRAREEQTGEELKAQLYQQIGQLQVELGWLKKKSGLSR
jgi:transposase-like protein